MNNIFLLENEIENEINKNNLLFECNRNFYFNNILNEGLDQNKIKEMKEKVILFFKKIKEFLKKIKNKINYILFERHKKNNEIMNEIKDISKQIEDLEKSIKINKQELNEFRHNLEKIKYSDKTKEKELEKIKNEIKQLQDNDYQIIVKDYIGKKFVLEIDSNFTNLLNIYKEMNDKIDLVKFNEKYDLIEKIRNLEEKFNSQKNTLEENLNERSEKKLSVIKSRSILSYIIKEIENIMKYMNYFKKELTENENQLNTLEDKILSSPPEFVDYKKSLTIINECTMIQNRVIIYLIQYLNKILVYNQNNEIKIQNSIKSFKMKIDSLNRKFFLLKKQNKIEKNKEIKDYVKNKIEPKEKEINNKNRELRDLKNNKKDLDNKLNNL